jgi:hypothetical protein
LRFTVRRDDHVEIADWSWGSTNGLRKAGTGLFKLSVMPSRRHPRLGLRVGSNAMAETGDLVASAFKILIMIRRKAIIERRAGMDLSD